MNDDVRARDFYQHVARPYKERLTLIPPLADRDHDVSLVEPRGFSLGGTEEVTERAREWALCHRYLLADGISRCAHGLYMLTCPGRCHDFGFDHTQIWVPADHLQRPFILTQPYVTGVPGRLRDYAVAHGLVLTAGMLDNEAEALSADWMPFRDNWYNPGSTMPIRLTIPDSWPMWPIEEHAALLLATQPVSWPDADEG